MALLSCPTTPGSGAQEAMPKTELDFVAPKIAAEIEGWLAHLGDERRYSPKTVEAYRRDVLQFLAFLAEHLGGPPSLKALAELDARRRARLHGGAPRRRHRQPLADALARRRARLCALSGTQRQGQGRRACRGAGAENRQDPAAAARRQRRQAPGRRRSRGRRRPRAVDSCARRRRAGLALRQRLADLRGARPQARRFRRRAAMPSP